ncbi:MAG: hypothetical protein QN157_03525 [Armatimonadota bacterium]|nr:hypothetical protein [Armatimonadota bacterium]
MSRRHVYLSAGVLAVVAALAVPVLAQPGPGFPAWGMHGWWWSAPPAAGGGALTIDAAAERVRQVLAAWGNPDLALKEIMEFSNHFYAVVVEKSTGLGAFELLVARNGAVRPEPGPNMMWNTKYGHMAGVGGFAGAARGAYGPGMMGGGPRGPGMMGPGGTPGRGAGGPGPYGPGMMGGGWCVQGGPGAAPGAPAATPTITRDRARALAAEYLAQVLPGAVPDEGTAFYGYFTFDVERAGKTIGMLSVNAYTGQVWYHTWHGTFIREKHF